MSILRGLSGFFFGPLLERGLARKFHAPFVVDADAFYPDHVPDFDHVFGSFNAEIRQLRNVDEAIFARQHFDERAKLFDRHDAPLIGLPDLDFFRHAPNNFLRPRHCFTARRVTGDRSGVFDVNLGTGLGDDAFDRLSTRTDKRADFFRIDLDGFDPWRVFRKFGARFVECAAHDPENFRARFFRTLNRLGHNFMAYAGEFQVELEASHTVIRSAQFEIHV